MLHLAIFVCRVSLGLPIKAALLLFVMPSPLRRSGMSHQHHVFFIIPTRVQDIFACSGFRPGVGKAAWRSPEGVQAVQKRMQNLMLLPGITK